MKTSSSKTKLLDAALKVVRARGYTATTVDEVCQEAGVTKGSFFHHFKGKEELAIEATRHWSNVTSAFFAQAPYNQPSDPRERVLGYIDFRGAILQGEPRDYTCLLGTMVQEVHEAHPAIRDACRVGIESHANVIAKDIAEAKAIHAPEGKWDPMSLALHTQAVLQGAFILAKMGGGTPLAAESVGHLRRYVEFLLPARVPSDAQGSPPARTPANSPE